MITTTYTCDKCGKDCSAPDTQLWTVQVAATLYKGSGPKYGRKQGAEWCRECMEQACLLPWDECKTDETPVPPPALTLEDLVRELIREEMQQAWEIV